MASNGNKNNQSKYDDHGNNERRQSRYDPAREAEVMLESMIEKHERYKLGNGHLEKYIVNMHVPVHMMTAGY